MDHLQGSEPSVVKQLLTLHLAKPSSLLTPVAFDSFRASGAEADPRNEFARNCSAYWFKDEQQKDEFAPMLARFCFAKREQTLDEAVARLVGQRPAIAVVNKEDLPQADDYARLLPDAPHLRVSAATGAGVRALEEALAEAILSGQAQAGAEPVVSDPRHRDLLQRAADALRAAQETLGAEGVLELVAVDVEEAVQALGEITGETAGEDLLETIFRSFCIGK